MPTFSAPSARASRKPRPWQFRAGTARAFSSLFLALSGLTLFLGSIFLYDAFAHPLSADAGQVLIGSVCLSFSLLLILFLFQERR